MIETLPELILICVAVVMVILGTKRKKDVDLGNELGRLVNDKKYTEAVDLATKSKVNEKSFHFIRLNLMAAYFHLGKKVEARKLLNGLKEKDFGSAKWILEEWREKLKLDK